MFKIMDNINGVKYETSDKATHQRQASDLIGEYARLYGRKRLFIISDSNNIIICLSH